MIHAFLKSSMAPFVDAASGIEIANIIHKTAEIVSPETLKIINVTKHEALELFLTEVFEFNLSVKFLVA